MRPDFDYTKLNELFHSRIRLAIASVLASSIEVEFTSLRDTIGATDGNLGTHLRKLMDAGYVEEKKEFRNRKPSTSYRLSDKGRKAFRAYVDSLERFIKG